MRISAWSSVVCSSDLKPQIGILWYVTGTIGIGLSIYPGSPLILIVGSACLGLALGVETELGAYYTSRFYDRKHFGEVLGLLSCCYTIGGALGGQIFSFFFDQFGDYETGIDSCRERVCQYV